MKNLYFPLTIVVSLCFFGCQKGDSSTVLSSTKNIFAIVFKSSDNPGLLSDVTTIVNSDTIKGTFPIGTSLNSLIPSISFSGRNISPINRTSQNFVNPVTYTITAEDGTTKNYILSCRVLTLTDMATLILGRWSVLRDSVSNIGNFYYLDGGGTPHYIIPGVYLGTSSDYYDFRVNGIVYLYENGLTANSPYQILSNGKLDITGLSVYPPAEIRMLNENKAAFFWASTSPNGGQYARMLYLIK